MSRIVVTLGRAELEALVKLSLAEVRIPRDQVRYILRQELERRGLLPTQDAQAQATKHQEET